MRDSLDPSAPRIRNGATSPNSGLRRSGGSVGDPHGGHQHMDSEWSGTTPNPPEELVPGGSGGVPPTMTESLLETSAYSGTQEPNLPDTPEGPELRSQDQPVEGAENRLRLDPQTGLPVHSDADPETEPQHPVERH